MSQVFSANGPNRGGGLPHVHRSASSSRSSTFLPALRSPAGSQGVLMLSPTTSSAILSALEASVAPLVSSTTDQGPSAQTPGDGSSFAWNKDDPPPSHTSGGATPLHLPAILRFHRLARLYSNLGTTPAQPSRAPSLDVDPNANLIDLDSPTAEPGTLPTSTSSTFADPPSASVESRIPSSGGTKVTRSTSRPAVFRALSALSSSSIAQLGNFPPASFAAIHEEDEIRQAGDVEGEQEEDASVMFPDRPIRDSPGFVEGFDPEQDAREQERRMAGRRRWIERTVWEGDIEVPEARELGGAVEEEFDDVPQERDQPRETRHTSTLDTFVADINDVFNDTRSPSSGSVQPASSQSMASSMNSLPFMSQYYAAFSRRNEETSELFERLADLEQQAREIVPSATNSQASSLQASAQGSLSTSVVDVDGSASIPEAPSSPPASLQGYSPLPLPRVELESPPRTPPSVPSSTSQPPQRRRTPPPIHAPRPSRMPTRAVARLGPQEQEQQEPGVRVMNTHEGDRAGVYGELMTSRGGTPYTRMPCRRFRNPAGNDQARGLAEVVGLGVATPAGVEVDLEKEVEKKKGQEEEGEGERIGGDKLELTPASSIDICEQVFKEDDEKAAVSDEHGVDVVSSAEVARPGIRREPPHPIIVPHRDIGPTVVVPSTASSMTTNKDTNRVAAPCASVHDLLGVHSTGQLIPESNFDLNRTLPATPISATPSNGSTITPFAVAYEAGYQAALQAFAINAAEAGPVEPAVAAFPQPSGVAGPLPPASGDHCRGDVDAVQQEPSRQQERAQYGAKFVFLSQTNSRPSSSSSIPEVHSPVPQTPTRAHSDGRAFLEAHSAKTSWNTDKEDEMAGVKGGEQALTVLRKESLLKIDLDTQQISPADSTPTPGRNVRNKAATRVLIPKLNTRKMEELGEEIEVKEEGEEDITQPHLTTPTKAGERQREQVRMLGGQNSLAPYTSDSASDSARPPLLGVLAPTVTPPQEAGQPSSRNTLDSLLSGLQQSCVFSIKLPPNTTVTTKPPIPTVNETPGFKFDPFAPTPRATVEVAGAQPMEAPAAVLGQKPPPELSAPGHSRRQIRPANAAHDHVPGASRPPARPQVSLNTKAQNARLRWIEEQRQKERERAEAPQYAPEITQSPEPSGSILLQDAAEWCRQPYPRRPRSVVPAPNAFLSNSPYAEDPRWRRGNVNQMVQQVVGAGPRGPLRPQQVSALPSRPVNDNSAHGIIAPAVPGEYASVAVDRDRLGFGRQARAVRPAVVQPTAWAGYDSQSPIPMALPQRVIPQPHLPVHGLPISQDHVTTYHPSFHGGAATPPRHAEAPSGPPPWLIRPPVHWQEYPSPSARAGYPSQENQVSSQAARMCTPCDTPPLPPSMTYELWLEGSDRYWEALCSLHSVQYQFNHATLPLSPSDLRDHEQYFRQCLLEIARQMSRGILPPSLTNLLAYPGALPDDFLNWLSHTQYWRFFGENLRHNLEGTRVPPIWMQASEPTPESSASGSTGQWNAASTHTGIEGTQLPAVTTRGTRPLPAPMVHEDIQGGVVGEAQQCRQDGRIPPGLRRPEPIEPSSASSHYRFTDHVPPIQDILQKWFNDTSEVAEQTRKVMEIHIRDYLGSDYQQGLHSYLTFLRSYLREATKCLEQAEARLPGQLEPLRGHLQSQEAVLKELEALVTGRPPGIQLEERQLAELERVQQTLNAISVQHASPPSPPSAHKTSITHLAPSVAAQASFAEVQPSASASRQDSQVSEDWDVPQQGPVPPRRRRHCVELYGAAPALPSRLPPARAFRRRLRAMNNAEEHLLLCTPGFAPRWGVA